MLKKTLGLLTNEIIDVSQTISANSSVKVMQSGMGIMLTNNV